MWGVSKNWLRQKRGVLGTELPSYLDEFMARWNFCQMDKHKVFWRMLDLIAEFCPPHY